MKMKDTFRKISITLPESLLSEMKDYCYKHDGNRSQLIRKSVKAYLRGKNG